MLDPDRLAELVPQIAEKVRMGASPELAAGCFGVHRQTYWRWRKAAHDGVAPYAEQFAPILQAEAEFLSGVQVDLVHAPGAAWLPRAWTLERRLPHMFSLSPHLRAPEVEKEAAAESDAERVQRLADRYRRSGAARKHLAVVGGTDADDGGEE